MQKDSNRISDRIRKGQRFPGEKQQNLLLGPEDSSLNRKTNAPCSQQSHRPQSRVMAPWQGADVTAHQRNPQDVPWQNWRMWYNPTWSLEPVNAQGKPPLINPLNEQLHMTSCEFKITFFFEWQASSSHVQPGPRKTRSRDLHLLETGLLQPRPECYL